MGAQANKNLSKVGQQALAGKGMNVLQIQNQSLSQGPQQHSNQPEIQGKDPFKQDTSVDHINAQKSHNKNPNSLSFDENRMHFYENKLTITSEEKSQKTHNKITQANNNLNKNLLPLQP